MKRDPHYPAVRFHVSGKPVDGEDRRYLLGGTRTLEDAVEMAHRFAQKTFGRAKLYKDIKIYDLESESYVSD